MSELKNRPIQRCPANALYLEYESAASGGRGTWYARVPADHTVDDVLHPSYFGMKQATETSGKGLREGDVIDIEPVCATWLVRARIMALRFEVQQVVLRPLAVSDYAIKVPAGWRLDWAGATARWRIFKGDLEVDQSQPGYDTQEGALERINELRRDIKKDAA